MFTFLHLMANSMEICDEGSFFCQKNDDASIFVEI